MLRYIAGYVALFVAVCSGTSLMDTLPVNELSQRHLRSNGPTVGKRKLQEDLPTIDDIILSNPNLTTLAIAFDAANLEGVLCVVPGCNFTAFGPTNEAFNSLNQEFLATLLTPSWILHLQSLLSFHITFPNQNRTLTTDFTDNQSLEMLNSETITVNILKRGIVLTSPLTLGSNIVEPDILAVNGAVNLVDMVFSPSFFGIDVFELGTPYPEEFSILQDLINILDLAGTMGEFTIFAPTNDAFLALGEETLDDLKEDPEALGRILSNHVVMGVYPSMFLTDGLVLNSLGGLPITVTVTEAEVTAAQGTTIMVNDATIVFPNILARNGIAHAIDMVILDPNMMSDVPSNVPSTIPSDSPSNAPSSTPSTPPNAGPVPPVNITPTSAPIAGPVPPVNITPTSAPSAGPSQYPSDMPSAVTVSVIPSSIPSSTPSEVPSDAPSDTPSDTPSSAPTATP